MFFLQILLNSLVMGTQVLLLAAGLYLIYAVTKIHHIALAGIMINGPYLYYSFQKVFPSVFAFILAIVITFVLGIISYQVLKSLIQAKQNLLALLVSMAIWLILESFFAMVYGSGGLFLSDGVLATFDFAGLTLTQVGFWTIIVGILIAIISHIVLYFLPIGRKIRAVAQHAECASLIGINNSKIKTGVFGATSAIAGLIGIFTAMNNALTPLLGTDLIIIAFIAVLVGGLQNFKGTIIASYFLVIIPELIISENFGVISLSSSWKMVIVFILALTLLILRPEGIFSSSLRKS